MEKNTKDSKYKIDNKCITLDVSLDEEIERKIRDVIIGKRKIETLIPAN